MDGLLRTAFVLVLCGLTAIYASSSVFTPPLVSPAEIDESRVGDTVRLNVTVEDVRSGDEAQFMQLAGREGNIRAVAFEPVDVEGGGRYLVRGEVSIYHGDLEIIVESAVLTGSHGNSRVFRADVHAASRSRSSTVSCGRSTASFLRVER